MRICCISGFSADIFIFVFVVFSKDFVGSGMFGFNEYSFFWVWEGVTGKLWTTGSMWNENEQHRRSKQNWKNSTKN